MENVYNASVLMPYFSMLINFFLWWTILVDCKLILMTSFCTIKSLQIVNKGFMTLCFHDNMCRHTILIIPASNPLLNYVQSDILPSILLVSLSNCLSSSASRTRACFSAIAWGISHMFAPRWANSSRTIYMHITGID